MTGKKTEDGYEEESIFTMKEDRDLKVPSVQPYCKEDLKIAVAWWSSLSSFHKVQVYFANQDYLPRKISISEK